MMPPSSEINIYLEIGQKRVFAAAIDWPGWCRSGGDEASALQALCDYGLRYARIVNTTQLNFPAPVNPSAFTVIERLAGNASTDFGAWCCPIQRYATVDDPSSNVCKPLEACWYAFDVAVGSAAGKELRKGPRGGGREVDQIVRHVLDADGGYLSSLGWKLKLNEADSAEKRLEQTRQAILDGLASAARGEVEARGPRGGLRWTPRQFVRRVAWHALDRSPGDIDDRII
jgi:hypothetical protein